MRAIKAARLDRATDRATSSVSREVERNGGRQDYRATKADEKAWEGARRPKRCLLARNDPLRDVVARKLEEDWSPEQISGWLQRRYPDDEAMRVSHETIYRTLFVQTRGALKRELLAHLRSRRMMRRGRHASTSGQPRGQIKEAVSIRERPPEAEDRAVPGHWEGDLISGSRNTHVATLFERSSRFVRYAGAGWWQGHRERRRGTERADKAAAQDHDGHPNLGQGNGDGRPQEVYRRNRGRRLLLRSEEPLATRHLREH